MDGQKESRLDSYELAKRDIFVLPSRKHRTLDVQLLLYGEVLELRGKSHSYSKIIEEIERRHRTKLSKSTISGWVNSKHIPLGRANQFSPARSPELAYIIGVEAGDGSLNFKRYSYRIRLKAIDNDFVQEFDRCISKVLSTPRHKLWKGGNSKEFQLEVGSYLLYKFLRRPFRDLSPWIERDSESVSSFLRGFFDSEGSVSEEGAVTVSNTNLDLLKRVQYLLSSKFGIATTGPRLGKRKGSALIRRGKAYIRNFDCYILYVRMACLATFYDKVAFSIGRKKARLGRALSAREA